MAGEVPETDVEQPWIDVQDWLDAHPKEFVILYLDTKPLTVNTKKQSDAASKVMRDVFGDMIWAKADGSVLDKTINELLAKGKRLFFEDHDNGYNLADDVIVADSASLMAAVSSPPSLKREIPAPSHIELVCH